MSDVDTAVLQAPTPEQIAQQHQSDFERYVREGNAVGLPDQRLGQMTGGGYRVSDDIEAKVLAALAEVSIMRRIAKVQPTRATKFLKVQGEAERRSDVADARSLDLQEFPSGELYAMPAATGSLLVDKLVNIGDWLAEEVRDVFATQESAAFISGDGNDKPYGLLSCEQAPERRREKHQLGFLETAQNGEIGIDDLIDLAYAPRPEHRANGHFMMNRRTLAKVRRLKDDDGHYIWRPAPVAGSFSTLLGYPVAEMEDMPDIKPGATPIAFGDFHRGYLIVDHTGILVLRDPYSAKPYILFYTTKRVGGGVQDFDAIKLLKMRG